MGKKKAYKKLAAAAAQLPAYTKMAHENHLCTGAEMIAMGHTEIDGVAVDPKQQYVNPMPVVLEINHKRRMKKLLNYYGTEAVDNYIQANK